jgi:hypothetical protein
MVKVTGPKPRISCQNRTPPFQKECCRFDNDIVPLKKKYYLNGGSYVVALFGDNYIKSRDGSNYRECVIQKEDR